MERAFTRSILGRKAGCSFCSTKVQRTPRLPRSIASVRPVGPAPTIKTSLSIGFTQRIRRNHSASDRQRQARGRDRGIELLEWLKGRVPALLGSGVDELRHLAGKKHRRFRLDLTAGIKLHADNVVLAWSDWLEYRLRNHRAAKVGAIGQGLAQERNKRAAVIGRQGIGIDDLLVLGSTAAAGQRDRRRHQDDTRSMNTHGGRYTP